MYMSWEFNGILNLCYRRSALFSQCRDWYGCCAECRSTRKLHKHVAHWLRDMILRRRYKTEKQQQQQLKSDLKSSNIADWGLWIGDSENKNNVGLGSSNGLRTPLNSTVLLCAPQNSSALHSTIVIIIIWFWSGQFSCLQSGQQLLSIAAYFSCCLWLRLLSLWLLLL